MIDSLPLWFAIAAPIVLTVAWFAVEIYKAVEIPSGHPEAVTGLDVLERTGVHPG